MSAPGPWTAADIRPGEPWEISNGHRIEAMGRRKRGGAAQAAGALVIVTDPGVEFAAVEVGFSPHPQMLRVLGVAVLAEPADSEWAAIAPPLAIEYADTGQDEPELRKKIDELLAAGTRFLWVVRLAGPRRVEVHQPGREREVVLQGELLHAPGVLKNPVPVEALFDPNAARRAALRNILQREGFESLQAVWSEGHAEGHTEGRAEGRAEGHAAGEAAGRRAALLVLLDARGIPLDDAACARIDAQADAAVLDRWLRHALTGAAAVDILE
jgi:hypothetical protein